MFNLRTEGKRIYVEGNTFPVKDKLKSIGAKWDADARCWWIGTGKKADLDQMLTEMPAPIATPVVPQHQSQGMTNETKIQGKATYNGKEYFLLYSGDTGRGYGVRLASLDGTLMFWAKEPNNVQVTKRYETSSGDRRGYGRKDAMTWGAMQRLRFTYKRQMAEGKVCLMCGSPRCESFSGGLCEND